MQSTIRTSPKGKRTAFARPTMSTRSGMTFIELAIVITVLLVAVSIFYRMISATSSLRELNRQNAVAADAARIVIERMYNEDFTEVFAMWNADPTDDPGGEGTAPGHRFFVDGLDAVATAVDGMHGEVIFPAVLVDPGAEGGGEGDGSGEGEGGEGKGGEGGGALGGGAGGGGIGGGKLLGGLFLAQIQIGGGGGEGEGAEEASWQLREDYDDRALGMPRDLNGDSITDDQDHKGDYLLLPVRVRVEWQGRHGPRSFELNTMLTNFKAVKR